MKGITMGGFLGVIVISLVIYAVFWLGIQIRRYDLSYDPIVVFKFLLKRKQGIAKKERGKEIPYLNPGYDLGTGTREDQILYLFSRKTKEGIKKIPGISVPCDKVTIGRSERCDIIIPDDTISKKLLSVEKATLEDDAENMLHIGCLVQNVSNIKGNVRYKNEKTEGFLAKDEILQIVVPTEFFLPGGWILKIHIEDISAPGSKEDVEKVGNPLEDYGDFWDPEEEEEKPSSDEKETKDKINDLWNQDLKL